MSFLLANRILCTKKIVDNGVTTMNLIGWEIVFDNVDFMKFYGTDIFVTACLVQEVKF
jgi:hypothetical protein